MATTPRRRRLLWAVAAVVAVALAAGGVLALALTRGWFDSGDVTGSTQGFAPEEAPRGRPDAGAWPDYGFDPARTRANPALTELRPPFRPVWRRDLGSLLEFPPVIADDRAIVGTNAGRAVALDVASGEILWNVRLRRTPGRRGRVASSPAIAGDRALFTTTGGEMVALDAATGRERWRVALGSAIESSPLVIDGAAYVGTLDGEVMRVRVRDGRVTWRARAAGDVKAGLAAAGPNVVVGDYGGEARA
jgi:outer membrane protein assembly factor BamB